MSTIEMTTHRLCIHTGVRVPVTSNVRLREYREKPPEPSRAHAQKVQDWMKDDQEDVGPWARRPLEGTRTRRWEIVRVKAGKEVRGIMLAGDLVGAYTHFWGGRTVACDGRACLPCSKNVELRWHGYLPLYSARSRETSIIEVTEACVEVIDRWFSAHRSLRGAMVTIGRPGVKANGMLRARLEEGPLPVEALPAPPDVKSILENMWGREPLNRKRKSASASDGTVPISKFLPGQTELPDDVYRRTGGPEGG